MTTRSRERLAHQEIEERKAAFQQQLLRSYVRHVRWQALEVAAVILWLVLVPSVAVVGGESGPSWLPPMLLPEVLMFVPLLATIVAVSRNQQFHSRYRHSPWFDFESRQGKYGVFLIAFAITSLVTRTIGDWSLFDLAFWTASLLVVIVITQLLNRSTRRVR